MNLKEHLQDRVFALLSETADELGLEAYIIGGYVRDILLQRPSKDIDVVVVGSGIEMAGAFARKLGKGAFLSVFKTYGTAQVKKKNIEKVIPFISKYVDKGISTISENEIIYLLMS